jgi:hypothetical protein
LKIWPPPHKKGRPLLDKKRKRRKEENDTLKTDNGKMKLIAK